MQISDMSYRLNLRTSSILLVSFFKPSIGVSNPSWKTITFWPKKQVNNALIFVRDNICETVLASEGGWAHL